VQPGSPLPSAPAVFSGVAAANAPARGQPSTVLGSDLTGFCLRSIVWTGLRRGTVLCRGGAGELLNGHREVGIPLVEGLMAFHRGAYDQAVARLQPVRFDLWRIGGSHAQRDIVYWTLTEAAVRGGLRDVALSLAHERLGTRPLSAVNRNFLWRAEQIAA
jgi:hypothetical protein